MLTDLKKGIERLGNVVNLAAALAANARPVYQVSNFNQQIGTKSYKAKKLIVRNNRAGNCWVNIGTGIGLNFVATCPAQQSLNDQTETFDLNGVEHFADMTVWVDALVPGGSLDFQVMVEEIG